jgi:serine protease Do
LLAMRDPSKHGWLGVAIESVPEALVPSLQLGDVRGALVAKMQPESPAERSGFRVGDVIASFNDTTVQDASGFMNLLAETDIGQTATITVLRDGRPLINRRDTPGRRGCGRPQAAWGGPRL